MKIVKLLKSLTSAKVLIFGLIAIQSLGCATNGKTIVAGMSVGAAGGAAIGTQFYHRGERSVRTQNAIIGAGIGALIAGGFFTWHYRSVERELERVSGRFARSKLCGADGGLSGRDNNTSGHFEKGCTTHLFSPDQVGEAAIDLDDNTKWALPEFRKRYMQPEREEDKVISETYLWEIVKPGSFVTRSQNAEYFLQTETRKAPQADTKSKLMVEIELDEQGENSVPLPTALPAKTEE